jgi:regulator of nucleoside diphosphate kinase
MAEDLQPIYLTNADYVKLLDLVQAERQVSGSQAVAALGNELKRAKLVSSTAIPPDVITMNSVVQLRELPGGPELEITLVYPREANTAQRKISILAPVATAVLGCRVGDRIQWPVPKGTATFEVKAILYQPEASSDFLR